MRKTVVYVISVKSRTKNKNLNREHQLHNVQPFIVGWTSVTHKV